MTVILIDCYSYKVLGKGEEKRDETEKKDFFLALYTRRHDMIFFPNLNIIIITYWGIVF